METANSSMIKNPWGGDLAKAQSLDMLRMLLGNTNIATLVIDKNKKVIEYNELLNQLFETALEISIEKGNNVLNYFPKHVLKSVTTDIEKAIVGEQGVDNEYNFKKNDGDQVWLHLIYVNLTINDELDYIIIAVRDISFQKRIFHQLYTSEASFKAIVQNSSDFISVVDTDGIFKFVSPSYKKRFAENVELIGRNYSELIHPEDLDKVRTALEQSSQRNEIESTIEYRMLDIDGNVFDVETKAINLSNNPVIRGFVGYTRDISDKKAAETQLKIEAYFDPLTQIANRQAFIKKIDELASSYRKQHKHFAIFFIDLDKFKFINDTLGHNIGDLLLVEVAARLKRISQKYMTFVARLGGDEFTMIVEENVNKQHLTKIASEIIEEMKTVFQIELKDIYIGCSIGINIVAPDLKLNKHSDSRAVRDEYMRNADQAMYLAKQRGKGQFAFYNYETDLHALEVYNSDKELRYAFDNDEFFVVFQPVVNITDNTVIMYESNLAWQHPEKGLLLDKDFISRETDVSILTLLINFQIQFVLETIKQIQEFAYKKIKCSINIESPKCNLENLYSYISKNSELYSVAPENIVMEIHPGHADQAASLHLQGKQGVLILPHYLDAFDTQSCNLMELLKSDFQGIKINWKHIHDNSNGEAEINLLTLKYLAQLFHLHHKNVIAYNVNSQEDVDSISASGITLAQGGYFSKPLTLIELVEYIKTNS